MTTTAIKAATGAERRETEWQQYLFHKAATEQQVSQLEFGSPQTPLIVEELEWLGRKLEQLQEMDDMQTQIAAGCIATAADR